MQATDLPDFSGRSSQPANPESDSDAMELGYEAALPFLNSQPGDLDLLFSPQSEAPTHER